MQVYRIETLLRWDKGYPIVEDVVRFCRNCDGTCNGTCESVTIFMPINEFLEMEISRQISPHVIPPLPVESIQQIRRVIFAHQVKHASLN
jgi:hypothetical protein